MKQVPRWATWCAHAALLTTLPSGLWRIAIGLQIPVGFTEKGLTEFGIPGWVTAYVFGLSVFAEALAFLTFGLVRLWGEVWPRWIPFLGGKGIHPVTAIVPAASGAIAVTGLTIWGALNWENSGSTMAPDTFEPDGVYAEVMAWCYAPLLLWGPLLALVTAQYAWRRLGQRPQDTLQPLGSGA